MKIITHSMTVVGTALLGSVTGALAGDVSQNFYVNGDVGAIFQQDARFSQTAEPTLNASFNPGIRADIAIGYNLSQNFALELEPGFTWNSVDTLDGRQLFAGESIDLYSVPILVNAIFKFPTSTGWTPYLGAGIGPDIGFFDGSLPGSTYTDTDVSFAFQGEAGVKYALSEHASVGLAYKFLGTTDQDYTLPMSPTYTDKASFHNVYIHGIFVNFTANF